MRQFYLMYHDDAKLQPLVGEISWAKHLGVATYRIVKRLPSELKNLLPASEQIARLLEDPK